MFKSLFIFEKDAVLFDYVHHGRGAEHNCPDNCHMDYLVVTQAQESQANTLYHHPHHFFKLLGYHQCRLRVHKQEILDLRAARHANQLDRSCWDVLQRSGHIYCRLARIYQVLGDCAYPEIFMHDHGD